MHKWVLCSLLHCVKWWVSFLVLCVWPLEVSGASGAKCVNQLFQAALVKTRTGPDRTGPDQKSDGSSEQERQ